MIRPLSLAILIGVTFAGAAMARTNNISQFVFRDTNRNGIYEIGESPYAGAPISLTHSQEHNAVQRSNLSGFANFSVSTEDSGVDVSVPGTWTFNMAVPDGFELTTGNQTQSTEMRPEKQSIGGLVWRPTPPFMGLAPILTIEAGTDHADTLTCSANGQTIKAKIDLLARKFVCRVGSGTWDVEWFKGGKSIASRSVTVGDWPVRLPFPTEPLPAPDAPYVVVDFENIIRSMNVQEMASGHGGVHWHNFVATHRKYYSGPGYINNTISGEFCVYLSSGHVGRLYYDEPFDFLGSFFGVAWDPATAGMIQVQALRDGKVVAQDRFYGATHRPIWFDAGFLNITELRISHEFDWQVVMDNMHINPPRSAGQ